MKISELSFMESYWLDSIAFQLGYLENDESLEEKI